MPWNEHAGRCEVAGYHITIYVLQNMCYMDLTLLDDQRKVMWCVSSAVTVSQPHSVDGRFIQTHFRDAIFQEISGNPFFLIHQIFPGNIL